MKKRIFASVIVIWIVLFALSASLYIFLHFSRNLGYINFVDKSGDELFIIETSDNKINFLNIIDGVEKNSFSVDVTDKNGKFTSYIGSCEEEDNLYVMLYHNRVGSTDGQTQICRVDMEKECLVEMFSYNSDNLIIDDREVLFPTYGGNFYSDNGILHLIGYIIEDDNTLTMADIIKNDSGEWEIVSERKSFMNYGALYKSGLYKLVVEYSGKIVYSNFDIDKTDGIYKNIYLLENDMFVLDNLSTGSFDILDTASGSINEFERINNFIENSNISSSQIRAISGSRNDPVFSVYESEGSEIVICDGEDTTVISSVKTDTISGLIIKMTGLWIISLAAAAVIVFVVCIIRYIRIIAVKVIAMIIPMILICNMSVNILVEKYLTHYNYGMMEEIMINNCKNTSILIDEQELNITFDDFKNSYEVQEKIKKLANEIALIEENRISSANSFTSTVAASYMGYDRKNNLLIDAYNNISFTEAENIELPEIIDAVKHSINNNESTSIITHDVLGQIVIYTIVPDSLGNGAYVISVSTPEIDYEIDQILRMISLIEFCISGAIILVLTIMIVISLVPLKKLRMNAIMITEGDPGKIKAEVNLKKRSSYNEIDLISDAFDNMLIESERKIKEINNLRSIVDAYFSDSLIKLVGKSNASILDFKENTAAVLYVTIILLDEEYSSIDRLDSFISDLSQLIKKYDAYISDIDQDKITIVSLKAESINIPYFVIGEDKRNRCIFDKSQMDIMIKGAENDYRFIVTYSDRLRMDELISCMNNTRIGFMASEKSLESNEGCEGICVYLYENEHFYDVFFSSEDHRKKLINKDMMEGLYHFDHGNIKQARECFVMAVKKCPGYYPPKYYIKLIEAIR